MKKQSNWKKINEKIASLCRGLCSQWKGFEYDELLNQAFIYFIHADKIFNKTGSYEAFILQRIKHNLRDYMVYENRRKIFKRVFDVELADVPQNNKNFNIDNLSTDASTIVTIILNDVNPKDFFKIKKGKLKKLTDQKIKKRLNWKPSRVQKGYKEIKTFIKSK